MKFIHIADAHLDSPFVNLAGKSNLSEQRRLEQRKVIKQIVEYIKKENIPYFFIAGDLYEQEYIKKSTIEYINNLFKEIPDTQIFITPGNHDPYIKNSFYKQYKWCQNVHIFTQELEVIHTKEADIYGYGFNDFYMPNNYENIQIENKNKINILITHGSLDGGNDENRKYNPLISAKLKTLGFDYVALGHIHKASYKDYENQNIVYPGSLISLGFDELGPRGFIEGQINEQTKGLSIKFIEAEEKTFTEKEINVDNIASQEELIEDINNLILDDNKYYKIILTGQRNFEINLLETKPLITKENIIKLKDCTKIKYNIEETSKQVSLKGLFAKKLLEKIENGATPEQQEKLLQAFEIGMDILK